MRDDCQNTNAVRPRNEGECSGPRTYAQRLDGRPKDEPHAERLTKPPHRRASVGLVAVDTVYSIVAAADVEIAGHILPIDSRSDSQDAQDEEQQEKPEEPAPRAGSLARDAFLKQRVEEGVVLAALAQRAREAPVAALKNRMSRESSLRSPAGISMLLTDAFFRAPAQPV